MRRKTWCVLDVNNLAFRALFTTGRLSHRGDSTGVAYGVFRDLKVLKDRFAPTGFAFCFDHGESLREAEFPSYKYTRHSKKYSEKELALRASCRAQVLKLRLEWLPEMGYKNLFWQDGYEADDIIASVVHNLDEDEDAIVVSGDQDMYQLISQRAMVYHPRGGQLVTLKTFKDKWKLHPTKWSQVKAIGGCSTDDVKGLKGVAEKTAAAFLRTGGLGDRKKEKEIYEFIKTDRYKDNLKLVKLPYPGCLRFVPTEDTIDFRKVREVLERLGIRSLQERAGIRSFGLRV